MHAPVAPPPSVDVVGAALVDTLVAPSRLLAARRTEPPAFAGWWELPGGKVEPGESWEDALRREIAEELGVGIVLGERVRGPLPDGRWVLSPRHSMAVWFAVPDAGRPAPIENHDELRWLGRDELDSVPWLDGDLPIIAHLRGQLRP